MGEFCGRDLRRRNRIAPWSRNRADAISGARGGDCRSQRADGIAAGGGRIGGVFAAVAIWAVGVVGNSFYASGDDRRADDSRDADRCGIGASDD